MIEEKIEKARITITLPTELCDKIDERKGIFRRTTYVAALITRAMDEGIYKLIDRHDSYNNIEEKKEDGQEET